MEKETKQANGTMNASKGKRGLDGQGTNIMHVCQKQHDDDATGIICASFK